MVSSISISVIVNISRISDSSCIVEVYSTVMVAVVLALLVLILC